MNSEEMNSYLSNIEEYVFDEKKIVTYSWLSKTCGLHTNVSKQLLYTFLESNPKKKELCATYLLIGVPSNGETSQVLIVKDKNLQEVESTLKSLTSKHVYSIQRCSDLSDLNVLYAAQKEESVDTISKGISAIEFNCNERDGALVTKLQLLSLPVIANQQTAAKIPTSVSSSKGKSPAKNAKSEQCNKCTSSVNDKVDGLKKEEKKSVIPSMFKNSTGPKKKSTQKVPVNHKKPQGIGAFFSKATSKPSNEPKTVAVNEVAKEENKTVPDVKERLSPLKENKSTLNICNESKSNPKVDELPLKPKKEEPKPKTTKKVDTKRGRKGPVKKAKEVKTRKRLVVLSDSDSEKSSDEEEVMREPTPEPEPTIIPDEEDMGDIIYGTPEPTKKRKKKLVSKTFTSPEGYMITEKEYVDVSGSEDEEAVPEKRFKGNTTPDDTVEKQSVAASKTSPKKKKASPKKKSLSPQKIKQASLMSFFKKK